MLLATLPAPPSISARFAQVDDRDGRFGGDALDVAVQKAVEHDVADAQHAKRRKIHEKGQGSALDPLGPEAPDPHSGVK